ncbi:MAG TPA: SH3 domain-containing protein [Gemmatimonadota bacterium]
MKVTIFTVALVFQLSGATGLATLHAQEYVVAVAEENFRARPNGTKLGTLVKGAPVAAVTNQGSWVKASLRGWIWKGSLRRGKDAATLVVSAAPGENLRATPAAGGRRLGTVLRGTPLVKLGQRGNWVQVRYDGWIWQPSLSAGGAGAPGSDAGSSPSAAEPAAGPGSADRTVSSTRENLRAAPNGARLGVLNRGADLTTLGSRGQWTRVALRGWFWEPSASGSGDTRKVARDTENLRIAPGTAVAGVLDRGTPLAVVGRTGKWLEVRLEGWIWGPSTLAVGGATSAAATASEGAAAEDVPVTAVAEAAESTADLGSAPGRRTADVAPRAEPPRVLQRSVPLKDAPDGALVGQALTGSSVVPVRASGDWVKVRFEGWIPRDALASSEAPAGPVTVSMVVAAPDAYDGARVTWALELIAVEKADGTRSDFKPGEHYLLTRSAVGEREYVYVAIPDGMAAELEALPAFTALTVRGVVRTGRSALVGNPIVELQELLDTSGP